MSERFNSSNADITFRSSDGTEFKLHRALLEAHTGAFPGPELDTQGEVVELTEPANILKILFDFVYPKRHPDLEDQNYEVVAAVAEAVGKYDVFSAMNTCNARLKSFLPKHAADIFAHAIKHDHPKLISDAVPYLARSPVIPVLEKLPASYMVPWSKYCAAWASVFQEGIRYIKRLPNTGHQCHVPAGSIFHTPGACHACLSSLFVWITNIEELDSLADLKDALQAAIDGNTILSCCSAGQVRLSFGSPSKPEYTAGKCGHVINLAKFCQEKIQAIPAFSTFVSR